MQLLPLLCLVIPPSVVFTSAAAYVPLPPGTLEDLALLLRRRANNLFIRELSPGASAQLEKFGEGSVCMALDDEVSSYPRVCFFADHGASREGMGGRNRRGATVCMAFCTKARAEEPCHSMLCTTVLEEREKGRTEERLELCQDMAPLYVA